MIKMPFCEKKLDKDIVLITSDYHMSRALGVFKHIFGEKYKFTVVKSRPFIVHKVQNMFAELESYGLDDFFLSQIAKGKHQKAEKLLYRQHGMYKR